MLNEVIPEERRKADLHRLLNPQPIRFLSYEYEVIGVPPRRRVRKLLRALLRIEAAPDEAGAEDGGRR